MKVIPDKDKTYSIVRKPSPDRRRSEGSHLARQARRPGRRGARPDREGAKDAIIKVTSSGIYRSDLHLYELLGPFSNRVTFSATNPMGIVEEVGADITNIAPGDRVVIPFNISCGSCFVCGHGLQSQCETIQVHEYDSGASLFGYTKLDGQVPGGQAEYLRVPQAHYGPIRCPKVLPTIALCISLTSCLRRGRPWNTRRCLLAEPPRTRPRAHRRHGNAVAQHRGVESVIAVDLVAVRLGRDDSRGVTPIDLNIGR